jgi:ATP-binding cassette subfamily B protein
VSGGEGQRVRLGRALLRSDIDLVILDEPFRGLGRDRRAALMTLVRDYWRHATLICVTHDVAETHDFDRVLVIDEGHIAEDGSPRVLEANADSRYHELLAAERDVRDRLWHHRAWRRLRIDDGRLVEEERAQVTA